MITIHCILTLMRGSRNFRQGGGGGGGPGQSDKKSSDVFFCFFCSPQLIRRQMVNFKEFYHFSRFQRGSNIFQEGPTFSGGGGGGGGGGGWGGGIQLLIPYRNSYNL